MSSQLTDIITIPKYPRGKKVSLNSLFSLQYAWGENKHSELRLPVQLEDEMSLHVPPNELSVSRAAKAQSNKPV